MILLCGRYEGVDERVAEHLATHEISVGDFVLSGGELPAAMILDGVTRLIPGALGNENSTVNESFSEAVGAGTNDDRNTACVLSRPLVRRPRAFSIARTIRARRRFAAGMCPKFYSEAITRKSADGAVRKRSKRRFAIARTC